LIFFFRLYNDDTTTIHQVKFRFFFQFQKNFNKFKNFLSYKLKSVAHLPWRMMTYKALNTFIDDIFAFVIKMPWLYRIGCFRDG
jgi:hypothetical protein